MPIEKFTCGEKNFKLQKYKKPTDIGRLILTHAAFCGSPMKHPHDPKKMVLVADPAGSSPFYYEFHMKDIEYMEEMPHITDLLGETFNMARVWVKKGSVGIRCIPFVAEPIAS